MAERRPAETLNAAADRLDALIAAATPGPWRLGIVYGTVMGASVTTAHVRLVDDAAYIAVMNPDVGRALAALLRESCASHDVYSDPPLCAGCTEPDPCQCIKPALDLARAILGERPEGGNDDS